MLPPYIRLCASGGLWDAEVSRVGYGGVPARGARRGVWPIGSCPAVSEVEAHVALIEFEFVAR